MSVNLREIERRRAAVFRTTPDRRIHTLAAAAHFIDRVGFCWLFAPEGPVPDLPSLFEAVKGRRGVHIQDWDADSDLVWGWKNELPAVRRAYYGKALAGRPSFVSLDMLPYLLAALGSDDLPRLYASGGISYDARRIYDTLERMGPLPTEVLRETAGFGGKSAGSRYRRSLDDLQRRLIVMPVGAARHGKAWATQIFELVSRWFPEEVAASRKIDLEEARLRLAARYIRTVMVARPAALARLFRLSPVESRALVSRLIETRRARVEGEWLLRTGR